MTRLPDSVCSECGRIIIYKRGYYSMGPMHLSCSKTGEPSEWVLENCRFPIPWDPKPDKLEGPDARGWLSPDGEFYGCDWMVHISMGNALARHYYGEKVYSEKYGGMSKRTDKDLEERKWVNITPDGFSMGKSYARLTDVLRSRRYDRYEDLTQPQLNALWDWLQSLEPTKKVSSAYRDLDTFFRTLANM